ncbi:hypothetical protein ENBRE01_1796 [Enteropsectra breve]|nr:hypothetical protein ENBRE01_1796 [Enteropsectra breve]
MNLPTGILLNDKRSKAEKALAAQEKYKKPKMPSLAFVNGIKTLDDLNALSLRTKREILKILESGAIDENLAVENNAALELFYKCCLVYKYRKNDEVKSRHWEQLLLKTLEKNYTALKAKEAQVLQGKSTKMITVGYRFMKNIFIFFKKATIQKFIKASVFNMKEALNFLSNIKSKLPYNFIDLVFEDKALLDDVDLFAGMNHMQISSGTAYNEDVFSHLLKYRKFKKFIFNYWQNINFVDNMAAYANRGDYTYYYRYKHIAHAPIMPLPKDYERYEFFNNDKHSPADIYDYFVNFSYNKPMGLYLSKNIEQVIALLKNYPFLEDLLKAAIENDAALAGTIWKRLYTEEDVFRRLVYSYKNMCDSTAIDKDLFNIITKNYADVTIKEAEKYINFIYEDELIDYFKERSAAEIIPGINEWSFVFYCKVFLIQLKSQSDKATLIQILNCVLNYDSYIKAAQENTKSRAFENVARLLDRIFEFKDGDIYERLNPNLKFIYAARNEEFRALFLEEQPHSFYSEYHRAEINHLNGKSTFTGLEGVDNIEKAFNLVFIHRDIAKYYIVELFDGFISEIDDQIEKEVAQKMALDNEKIEKEPADFSYKRTLFYLQNKEDYRSQKKRIEFVFRQTLNNKYTLYILLDKILSILGSPANSPSKILLLSYISPALLTREDVLKFTDKIIPLLNNTNNTICILSKRALNSISVENQEINNVFAELVQALVDKKYAPSFFSIFRNILFNNYLCFNSLSILLQVFFKYISEYTNDVLDILLRIQNITKETDLLCAGSLIFNNLNKYAVQNLYKSEEVCVVSRVYAIYSKFEDYKILIENSHKMQTATYMVKILKSKGDSVLNKQILQYVLSGKQGSISPCFIAAACELSEFNTYISSFIDILKGLFLSQLQNEREVAVKAFKQILNKGSDIEDVRRHVFLFVVKSAIYEDHLVRLNCLELISHVPLLFYMKNDPHLLVRKKAYDLWKDCVINPNKELKEHNAQVLDFIYFYHIKNFRESVLSAMNEMAVKYTASLELYYSKVILNGVENKSLSAEIITAFGLDCEISEFRKNEFILEMAVKNKRLYSECTEFVVNNYSEALFNLLYEREDLRAELREKLEMEVLLKYCQTNSSLAMDMFEETNDGAFLKFLGENEKLETLKVLISRDICAGQGSAINNGSHTTENIKWLFSSIQGNREVEELLLSVNSLYSLWYLKEYKENCGNLQQLFIRIFDQNKKCEELIRREYMSYIKGCSFQMVGSYEALLALLLEDEDKTAFERAVELIHRMCDDKHGADRTLSQKCTAFILRSYLMDARRESAQAAVKSLYHTYKEELGYFKTMIENSNLNN